MDKTQKGDLKVNDYVKYNSGNKNYNDKDCGNRRGINDGDLGQIVEINTISIKGKKKTMN